MRQPPDYSMHDWVLVSILIDWKVGEARLELRWDGRSRTIVARGVSNLTMPKLHPWGPSVQVNESHGPIQLENGSNSLSIEMQSGDKIELIANEIEVPRD